MTKKGTKTNRVRRLRLALGLTQAELASRAGISRTAVTAIEGEHLVPSVAAAIAVARALETTVEELFGAGSAVQLPEAEAWNAITNPFSFWNAEISGKTIAYPAGSAPMLALLPDGSLGGVNSCRSPSPRGTLVIASCDPAAGILATHFAAVTGFRLLVLPRSSHQAIEMLRDGLVHLAGLHLSTQETPDKNSKTVKKLLGPGFQMLRIAHWHEGITFSSNSKLRSVKSAANAKLSWVGREPGSGARQCLDHVLDGRAEPQRIAIDHRGVAEAVRAGWADAGICVELASAEAGLGFLPVQKESYEVCFPEVMANDPRIKAFVNVVRSSAYRTYLANLPGYDIAGTGDLWPAA